MGSNPDAAIKKGKIMIDWDNEKDLGYISDGAMAYKHQCSVSAARSARIRRGISKCGRGDKYSWDVDWDKEPLGVVSDSEIALSIGCSVSNVRYHRIRRGIEPCVETNRREHDWEALLRDKENRGLTITELADKYNVCKQVVEFAVNYSHHNARPSR